MAPGRVRAKEAGNGGGRSLFLYGNLAAVALLGARAAVLGEAGPLEGLLYSVFALAGIVFGLRAGFGEGLSPRVWLTAQALLLLLYAPSSGLIAPDAAILGVRHTSLAHFCLAVGGGAVLSRHKWPFDAGTRLNGPVMAGVTLLGLFATAEVVRYAVVSSYLFDSVVEYHKSLQGLIFALLGGLAGAAAARLAPVKATAEAVVDVGVKAGVMADD